MRFGKISFQANDNSDVFLVEEIWESGHQQSDEGLLNITDLQFEGDHPWVTGNVPQLKPVNVEGDTTTIQGWFKGDHFRDPFVITVYVECEMSEELIKEEDKREWEDRQPQEIII